LEDEEWHEVEFPEGTNGSDFGHSDVASEDGKEDAANAANSVFCGEHGDEEVISVMEDRAFKEKGTEHVVQDGVLPFGLLGEFFLCKRSPKVVFVQVIGMGVVIVVGHFPTIIRKKEGHHADSPKELVHHSAWRKGLMCTGMSDYKKTSDCCPKKDPGKRN